jgi:nicotinate-nucleotide adenylyltransferase
LIGFLGGTFDPIHNGHLHAAATAAAALDLERVELVLAAQPKHRAQPHASVEQRWAMLELAVAGNDLLRADDREIRRGSASYTVETLEEVREENGALMPIVWLLGWDAYRNLTTWHRWRDLLSFAHLAVMRRPGSENGLDETMWEFTAEHRVDIATVLHRQSAGWVFFLDAPMLSISSTDVRARLEAGEDVDQLLPSAVWTYIKEHQPYRGPSYQ